MRNAEEILESLEEPRLRIVETGNVSTRSIARWVSQHRDSEFVSVDLNSPLQLATHRELECDGTARYCTFLTQDHNKFLSAQTWRDVCFLNPPDLQDGLIEFSLAASTGARLIVISDYQTRAALAVRKARESGWTFESHGMLSVLRRSL